MSIKTRINGKWVIQSDNIKVIPSEENDIYPDLHLPDEYK
jgi:hypothetical protein